MLGRHHGICRNKVVRLPQVVGVEQHQAQQGPEYDHEPDEVFNGVIPVKGDLVGITVHAKRIVPARSVQEENVKADHKDHHEGDQEVKSKKAGQGRVADREAPPEPRHQVRAHVGEGGKEVRDNRSPSEPHLPPREHVAQEGGRHYENKEQNPSHPRFNIHVPAVVDPAADMGVNTNKEESGTVGVGAPQQSPGVYIPENVIDGGIGQLHIRGIVYGQE